MACYSEAKVVFEGTGAARTPNYAGLVIARE